jgi:hypothetical protein
MVEIGRCAKGHDPVFSRLLKNLQFLWPGQPPLRNKAGGTPPHAKLGLPSEPKGVKGFDSPYAARFNGSRPFGLHVLRGRLCVA